MHEPTVLVVDDENAIRDMLRMALEMADFRCIEADNIHDAYTLVVDERPDIVLLDWMLPGGSGLEMLRRLKRGETTRELPVIMLTAKTAEDNVIQQVAERFQINNRANDIKLNLKLHPEELGELKIDLTLKEGSIKGNIVAQSQQIQEIIEKNMIKLRSILEDQGFTVEEIVVTSESDSLADFDLFEQHLSQQSDFTPPFTDSQQDNDFDGALEDAVVQSADSLTGVNIKA